MNNNNIENYLRRLKEVLSELETIGKLFEGSSKEDIAELANIAQSINKLRVPGFCGYYLAQEGLSLLNLIAVSVVNDKEKQKELKSLEELEPYLQRTLENMAKFKTLNGKDIIQDIANKNK